MKPVRFGILGVIIQGIGLAAFIWVSRASGAAALGQAAVIGLMLSSVALLLWRGIRQAKTLAAVFLLPVLLALGWVIVFHSVGALGIPEFRRVMEFSTAYVLSVLGMAGIVFVLYAVATALLFSIIRGSKAVRRFVLSGLGVALVVWALVALAYPAAIGMIHADDLPPGWSPELKGMTIGEIHKKLGPPQDDMSAKGWQSWVIRHWWGNQLLRVTSRDTCRPEEKAANVYYMVYVDVRYNPVVHRNLGEKK